MSAGGGQSIVLVPYPQVSSAGSRSNHSEIFRPAATVAPPQDENIAAAAAERPISRRKSLLRFSRPTPPPADRIFIASPPKSILDINLDAKHAYAYLSWPVIRDQTPSSSHPLPIPHSIPEEPPSSFSLPSQRQQEQPSSRLSSPSSSSKQPPTTGASFAQRMRGKQNGPISRAASSSNKAKTEAEITSSPRPYPSTASTATGTGAAGTAPPPSVSRRRYSQISTPATHHSRSHSHSSYLYSHPNNSRGNDNAIENQQQQQQQQLQQQQELPRLQRRQSLWYPLKSKFSLVRLRGEETRV